MESPSNASNIERARNRQTCRNKLSEYLSTTLDLHIAPEQIRLQPKSTERYRWQVHETIAHLFTKGLSKLSIGAYDQLIAGAGTLFTASLSSGSEKTLTNAHDEISRLEDKVEYWKEFSINDGRARIAAEEEIRMLGALIEASAAREKEFKRFLFHTGQAVSKQLRLVQGENVSACN